MDHRNLDYILYNYLIALIEEAPNHHLDSNLVRITKIKYLSYGISLFLISSNVSFRVFILHLFLNILGFLLLILNLRNILILFWWSLLIRHFILDVSNHYQD